MIQSSPKKAVQFGAGNIGRGFIGVLLSQAGYEVIFVDVVEPLVNAINQQGQYTIKEVVAGEEQAITVENVRAINGKDETDVAEAISQATLITTAVGPNVLPVIASGMAQGLRRRAELKVEGPLNIIACENLIGNTRVLQKHVLDHLPSDYHHYVEHHIGFPNCVVDKVVTNPSEAERAANPLSVIAGGEGQLIVDRHGFVGNPPVIEGVKLTDNLAAYVEQKIFTLNTAHALTAYLGYLKGVEFIHEALQDPEIRQIVLGAMEEINAALIKRHNLEPAAQERYAASVLSRFENAALPDPVIRVGREPKRKLAPNDRLIAPALLALDIGLTPTNLAMGIAAALHYDNPDDPQAVEISNDLKEKGVEAVLANVCHLAPNSTLAELVKKRMADVKKLHQEMGR